MYIVISAKALYIYNFARRERVECVLCDYNWGLKILVEDSFISWSTWHGCCPRNQVHFPTQWERCARGMQGGFTVFLSGPQKEHILNVSKQPTRLAGSSPPNSSPPIHHGYAIKTHRYRPPDNPIKILHPMHPWANDIHTRRATQIARYQTDDEQNR